MFFGEHQHSLDAKGRLILPSKFRDAFATGGYVTRLSDGCLGVFTAEEFARRTQEILEKARRGKAERQALRVWAAGAEEIKPDKQGRIPLPLPLRTYAGLTGEVVVTGVVNHVELWNPERWIETAATGSEGLASGDEVYADMGF